MPSGVCCGVLPDGAPCPDPAGPDGLWCSRCDPMAAPPQPAPAAPVRDAEPAGDRERTEGQPEAAVGNLYDAPGELAGDRDEAPADDGQERSVAVSRTGLQCSGQRPDGSDCRSFVIDFEPGGLSGYCWNCSPRRRQEREEARRRGGMRSRGGGNVVMEGPLLENAGTLVRLYGEVWAEAAAQRPGHSRIRSKIALLSLGAKLLELSEYERRIQDIERALRRGGLLP